ncbi:MAG: prolipoprotein diacylglyceryl transferase [Bacteroidetes bacterium]|nr:prolipoprotein diacylglyceryl transferase [Bacteroidota bacterium]MBU1423613.1 prolipoprotein diacylglyceryl transferase [Bacteroidota bacterium]MBU2636597.1 prolipoprotein diacylglyceryl transferase [Bacteroidota bacterium]
MYPELVKIGPLTVYSYGLMLGIAFITASFLLTKELKRKKLDPNLSGTITLLAVVCGIVGAKLFHLIENWEYFLRAPVDMIFSAGGLTFYGGFILATAVIIIYLKKKKVPVFKITDAAAPGLMIGYGIARIGCHLSGDGDYGVPTNLPWAMSYEKGTYPPSVAFKDFPEIVEKYGVKGVVPDNILVHPTPLYELIAAAFLFFILWKLRKKFAADGKLFMTYLIFSGSERLLVEFIRINPKILYGLSEAQIISIVLMIIGFTGLAYLKRKII